MTKNAEELVVNFLNTMASFKFDQLEPYIAEDVTAHITTPKGGSDQIQGKTDFLNRFHTSMDISHVTGNINITQLLTIRPEEQFLVMVEIKAFRSDTKKSLHNFAAYLINIKDLKIKDFWMVEALPAYSTEFWKY